METPPMVPKQRHGCLTTWLIIMMIAKSGVGLFYLFGSASMAAAYPHAPTWAFFALALISFANLAGAIALFMWKKWGFYLFAAMSVIIFGINLVIGVNIIAALFGFIGLAFLYGVLQIGKENKGWPQLE